MPVHRHPGLTITPARYDDEKTLDTNRNAATGKRGQRNTTHRAMRKYVELLPSKYGLCPFFSFSNGQCFRSTRASGLNSR